MLDLVKLRSEDQKILMIGSHLGIIQSILDFDFLTQKNSPSVVAIIASGRKFERYFFGKKEILIPVFSSVQAIPDPLKTQVILFLNVSSARRVLSSTLEILDLIPGIQGGVIFAEDVPEKHALELYKRVKDSDKFIIGPASVGLLLPNHLKLGAIGGVATEQLVDSHLFSPGSVAVFSASGGMTNEMISIVTKSGRRISFALHFGGDRFPILQPVDAFLLAENDPETKMIVYYGELGGQDEYEIAKLLEEKRLTKKVIVYIAGTISDSFEAPPQFGHAKALAKTQSESARAKRDALKDAGALVGETFEELIKYIQEDDSSLLETKEKDYTSVMTDMSKRRSALITTSISGDENGVATVLGEDLLSFVSSRSFGSIVGSMFLGKPNISKMLETFIDFVLRLLVEHGPYVSGAVNTIVTARAGRDLVSSLSSGLLTIGPRFGGAINEAAGNWLRGVTSGDSAHEFVESFARQKKYVSGIGHRKYRSDNPDPRVKALLTYADSLKEKRFTSFALSIEKITTSKKGNLILNVDGTIAAVLLDILSEKEKYSDSQLEELVDTEFFNALFVLSRSVGFISHFLDQKRLDEGLFRLDEDLVVGVD